MGIDRDSIEFINAIYELDSNLIPRKKIGIDSLSVLYFTELEYGNSTNLKKEILYIMTDCNNRKAKDNLLKINFQTSMKDIALNFNMDHSNFWQIGSIFHEKNYIFPIWASRGPYNYR